MSSIPTGKFITGSAEETFELAYSIGEGINEPTVFLLDGELGTGKTVFAKGIAAGLEIDPQDVNSPTFTIINQHQGRMRMYHIDLYRIEGAELGHLGLEELLDEADAVIVVEWAERLGELAIPGAWRVNINDSGGEFRSLFIVFNT
ncbi:MAG: tRNA (adenosine(37)-N6)-threonylcarbamoyltransferase complex ATPase subunit type 1 TsaE [Acidobacteria bacterium]|nr:tRNA (adenosine(37)-N6)-threonylcarbamoyltransferase complex ATPase subunit type 1 TsaE [Acidobacteriota bacterium]